ncbi:1507_t:CDS:2 [Ambispora leptoticha]|uniref:1507_t:CDS:1 n=1 Tax=Ambispora leptoticha TaxID=144679 RepID=A0A9N9G330_9GLOM|nr:1507_t:CDS:2 [Ambispora leptoticha]
MGNCLDKPRENGIDSDPRSFNIPLMETSLIESKQSNFLDSEKSNINNGNHSHNMQCQQHEKNAFIFSMNANNDRFAKLHALFKYTWQANFLAPVDERLKLGNARVLDLGCRTGEWVLDVSVQYPLAKVCGIDKLNFFPSPIPLNSVFLPLDILDGLPFDDNTFDLVHTCCSAFTYTEIEWKQKIIKELIRVLKPGTGWLSLLEISLFYTNEGPNTAELTKHMRLYLKEKKINPDITKLQENLLRASNQFTDIQVYEKSHILESNSSRAGDIAAKEFALTMYALGKELSSFMGLDNEGYESLVELSVKEFNVYKTSARQIRIIARRKSLKTLMKSGETN